jgi:pimeloyl-ACP methyl ester carboxylesterase
MASRRVEIVGSQGVPLVGDLWVADPAGSPKGVALLLHGGGQTRHSWASTGGRLSTQGWTALSVDARGHGESGWASRHEDYGLQALVDDLAATVAWIGEPPVVLGASMGGITAMVAEGEQPGLLRALVLVDVTPTLEPDGVDRISGFMRSGLEGFDTLEKAADSVAAYNPHRERPKNLDGLRKNLREGTDGRWYWHWDPAFLALDPREADRGSTVERRREAAARLRVPTLLVRGTRSDIVSRAGAMELLELVPGARLVEVPQAGHMVAGDDNDVFTAEVESFLSGLEPLRPL